MAHKDGQGKVILSEESPSLPQLPKDANGQVLIPDNLSPVTKAYTGKPVIERSNPKSAFADAPVVNAFTNF